MSTSLNGFNFYFQSREQNDMMEPDMEGAEQNKQITQIKLNAFLGNARLLNVPYIANDQP